jgi:hypothetical protein
MSAQNATTHLGCQDDPASLDIYCFCFENAGGGDVRRFAARYQGRLSWRAVPARSTPS